MTSDPKKPWHTLSVWCALAGMAGATSRKTRAAAALPLLLAGIGYLGIEWERRYQADIRNLRQRGALQGLDRTQLVLHAGMVAAGIGLLRWQPSRSSLNSSTKRSRA